MKNIKWKFIKNKYEKFIILKNEKKRNVKILLIKNYIK